MAPTIIQQSQPAAARQGWQIAVATLVAAIAVWFLLSLSSAVPSAGTAAVSDATSAGDPVLDVLMTEAPAWVTRAEIAPPTAEQRAEAAARRAAAEPTRAARNLARVGMTTPASGSAVLDGDLETFWQGHRLVVAFSPAAKTGEVVVDAFGPVGKTVRINGGRAVAVNADGKTTLEVEGGTLRTVEVTVEGVTVVPNGVRDLLVY